MLNVTNFEMLIKQSNKDKEYFQSLLSEVIEFRDISQFPNNKGLYFLYVGNILLYIGSVSANKRTIKIRCQQYLQKGSGGESFRGKIEKLQKISADNAIKFIKDNISAKFINYNHLDTDHIKQLEQIAICCYQPTLNFILKKFDYRNLQVENK